MIILFPFDALVNAFSSMISECGNIVGAFFTFIGDNPVLLVSFGLIALFGIVFAIKNMHDNKLN